MVGHYLEENRKSRGFTFVELVVVVLIVAILAAYVAAKVGTPSGHSVDALADMICADIRHLQRLAMKENTIGEIRFTSTGYTARKGGADYTGGHFPVVFGNRPEFSDIRINPDVTLRFNSRGQPVNDAGGLVTTNTDIHLTIDGVPQKILTLIAYTGYVEIH